MSETSRDAMGGATTNVSLHTGCGSARPADDVVLLPLASYTSMAGTAERLSAPLAAWTDVG
jgi:hypothetical protein